MVNKRFVCCILLVWINFVSTQEPEETTVPVLDPFQSGDETTTVDNTFLDESTVSIPEEETTPPLLDEGGFVEDTTIITTSDLLTESTAPTEVSTEELSNELGSMDDVSPAPLLDVDQPAEVFTEAPLAEDSTLDTISTGTAEETFVAVDVTTSPADTGTQIRMSFSDWVSQNRAPAVGAQTVKEGFWRTTVNYAAQGVLLGVDILSDCYCPALLRIGVFEFNSVSGEVLLRKEITSISSSQRNFSI